MYRHEPLLSARLTRRSVLSLGLGCVALSGCTSALIRGQSPEVEDVTADENNSIQLVGDYCGGWGLEYKKLQAVGLVTNLSNTGSDPPPGQARDILLEEMQRRDVKNPQKVLGSPQVSLVEISVVVPPSVQKGDKLDVMINVPKRSATTSLRGGWLMQSRLRQMANVNGKIHEGHEAGWAEGNVTIDSIFLGSSDKTNEVKGRILGGAISSESRTLGLVVRRDDVSIETTSVISAAVNQRFHTFDRGTKKGVAEPKDANFVKLLVPARYKNNLRRYVSVVRSIPLRESSAQRSTRLMALEQKLFEPTTSEKASLQLEAIGKEAIAVLKKGLKAQDLEIRFHSAEALAFLDLPDAAEVLGEAARTESAFRMPALSTLSSMDHVHAYEQLTSLLHASSAETRYGAFRSLRRRSATDPLVRGESLGGQFSLHIIPTTGEPMIHISRLERCEIVLFGQEIALAPPQGIYAGKQILLTSPDGAQVKISRFTPGKEDRVAYSALRMEQVIRSIASLGGTYGDVIQAIHEAKQAGLIEARVAVDAVPRSNRTYHRDDEEGDEHTDGLNRLMQDDADESSARSSSESSDTIIDGSDSYVDPKFAPTTSKSTWSRMMHWIGWSE